MAALGTTFAVTPTSAAETSLTVQPPACTSGCLLVMTALAIAGSGVAANTPSGWARQSAGGAPLAVFTRTATSSESAYTVTFPSACAAVVTVASYPAATVSASFASSGAGVVTYSPTFPGGVTGDQIVVLVAGVLTSATGTFSGSTGLDLPSSWTWEIPPIGPQELQGSPAGVSGTCAAGMASVTGSASTPQLTAVQGTQFYAGYLVLSVTATEPPWLRVTATVTSAPAAHANVGQPGAGMALTVKALSGADTPAAIAQAGATASVSAAATQATLTPAQSGSLLYGALSSDDTTAAYTAAARTTFSQDIWNTANGVAQAYGTFAAGPVTAGSPVTAGASGPAAAAVNIAVAEILATAPLAETATAQASATVPWDYAAVPASQTAIFTTVPAAGSLLVAMVSWSKGDGTVTVALSDTLGLAWAELVRASGTGAGYAGVWIAQMPGAPPPPQAAGSGCMFGLRPVPTTGVTPESDFAGSVTARELLLGRKLDLVATWRNWDPATENTAAEAACIAGGRIPVLSWPLAANVPAGANAGITAGTYDSIIYGWGQKIATLGGRVLFRPMPDANTDPNFGPSPATFVTSWQRIWTILKGSATQFAALSPACTAGPALSLGNVEFVWSMAQRATSAGGGNLWASYYPGAGFVDWIALDAYNTSPPTQLMSTLLTSGDYVDPASSHNWYATYAGTRSPGGAVIPLMISGTGATEADDPGVTGQPWSKAYWLTQAAALIQQFPAVRAVVYTDEATSSGDFRLDTAPGAVVTSDATANPTLAAAVSWAEGSWYDRRMRVMNSAGELFFLADPAGS